MGPIFTNEKCHVLTSEYVLSSNVTLVRGCTEDILDMPFLIHECDITHSNMRRDSLMDVGRHEFVGVWWHCWSLFTTRLIDGCEYVSFANEAWYIEFFCRVNIGLFFGVYTGHLWGSFAREETPSLIVTRLIYVCEHDSFVCRYGVSMCDMKICTHVVLWVRRVWWQHSFKTWICLIQTCDITRSYIDIEFAYATWELVDVRHHEFECDDMTVAIFPERDSAAATW